MAPISASQLTTKNLHRKDIEAAARQCAALYAEDPPPPDRLIPRAEVLAKGGMPEWPSGGTPGLFDRLRRAELVFFTAWKDEIQLLTDGRTVETVVGEGFRLLAHNEVIPHAEQEVYNTVRGAMSRFRRTYKRLDPKQLSPEEQREATDAKMRMGRAAQTMRRIQARKETP